MLQTMLAKQWADCDDLCPERLKSLPKGLTKTYEDNLKRILNQDDEDNKELTLKIVLWIANAIRPLSRSELL